MKRVLFFVLASALLALGWVGNAQAKLKLVAKIKKGHCQHPKWSGKGNRLSYEVHHVLKRVIEIRIHNWGSKGKHKVINAQSLQSGGLGLGVFIPKKGMVSREMAWSPVANKYLFVSNGKGSVYNVYLSREGPLKGNSKLKSDGQPAWNSNGKYAVFTSARTGKGDLYLVKMSGSNLKARRLTKYGTSTELFPSWSPKKSLTLAFVRHTDQSDRIYVMKNIFVKKSKRLTKWRKRVIELNPSWSPNGKQIAFFGQHSNGRYDLYVANVATGKVKRLAKNVVKSDQYGPAWSPSGKHIFCVKKLSQNRDRIYAVNVASRALKAIRTNTVVNNELAVKAHGGKWHIAFTAQGKKRALGLVYRKLYVKVLSPF